MSTATSENQCTGCGATVTQWGMEKYWRDVSGSTYCEGIPVVQNQHYVLPEVKNVSLPPVAIKPEVAPQIWFRETETLNFLYIARPDGRFLVVAMETKRGDIYAIENSPAKNPSAKPMAVRA